MVAVSKWFSLDVDDLCRIFSSPFYKKGEAEEWAQNVWKNHYFVKFILAKLIQWLNDSIIFIGLKRKESHALMSTLFVSLLSPANECISHFTWFMGQISTHNQAQHRPFHAAFNQKSTANCIANKRVFFQRSIIIMHNTFIHVRIMVNQFALLCFAVHYAQ